MSLQSELDIGNWFIVRLTLHLLFEELSNEELEICE